MEGARRALLDSGAPRYQIETDFHRYERDRNALLNHRVEAFLTDRTSNPALRSLFTDTTLALPEPQSEQTLQMHEEALPGEAEAFYREQ